MLKVQVPPKLVHGEVEQGYGPVADAFRRNFTEGGEIGAAVAVYRDGEQVVDLWGGYRDGLERSPWERDTLVNVFSTTKGIASMAIAVAHSRALLDYDAPVATYWPEFATNGKQHVTVRQLLSHQAGLAAIDRPLDLDTLANLDLLADALAEQAPAWDPGTRHGYHAFTLGWYEGELLRRVDPERRSLGRFFGEEIATALGIEFYIGVPDDLEASRFATIHGFHRAEMLLHMHELPPRFVLALLNPKSLTGRAFGNPKLLGALDNYNRREVRRLEIPASNGHGHARSIAAAYEAMATGGEKLGLTPETLAALSDPAHPPTGGLRDQILHVDTAYSLGYMKPFSRLRFGTSAGKAFGTPGAGGSFGFADPDAGIGFAYVMNRCGFHLWDDPREVALRQALYHDVLGEAPQHPTADRT
jgi:CubicO group peptidase (beta-lactamase class C family)